MCEKVLAHHRHLAFVLAALPRRPGRGEVCCCRPSWNEGAVARRDAVMVVMRCRRSEPSEDTIAISHLMRMLQVENCGGREGERSFCRQQKY